MKTLELKVKIKSLAEEAKIIRSEEKKLPGTSGKRMELHNHRVVKVRRAARYAQLAYGYLRGKPYQTIEIKSRYPLWELSFQVADEVRRFCEEELPKEEVIDAIRDWLKGNIHETHPSNPCRTDVVA